VTTPLQYEETGDALHEYILRHIDAEPELLHDVQRLTHLRLTYSRMCSGHLQGRLLKMLCSMMQAHRILELGTFSGYSALSMAEALTPDPTTGAAPELHTIEVFDELEDFLRDVFGRTPLGQYIHLHIGDAVEIIPTLEGTFDVAFIDADKRRYNDYYDLILPRMRPGGLILADNTLLDGKVLTPPKETDRQSQGIQAFNDRIAEDNRVEKVILPLRDGLTMIRVK
jgi:predicted O-methyltransferase YrrM